MLETIYITRHGFRADWSTDPNSVIASNTPSPTGIPSDVTLTAHGVKQSLELRNHLLTVDLQPSRIYTSPFYRCLETIDPYCEAAGLTIRPDRGIGEWFSTAKSTHPSAASSEVLKTFFERVDVTHKTAIVPSRKGETMVEIHDRTAYALARIIQDCDRVGDIKAILLCGHAAPNIAASRALTGEPEGDVLSGTCSLGVYKRRKMEEVPKLGESTGPGHIPHVEWRGCGLAGGWEQTVNGDCSFLSGGEEMNWWFEGDDDWDFPVKAEVEVGGQGGPGVGAQAGKEAEAEEANI